MVSQIRSRLRDMNKLEQRHKFSPRAILARDHGSPGCSYTISPIFSSFSVSLCVGAPYSVGGRLFYYRLAGSSSFWFMFCNHDHFDMLWSSHHTPAYPVKIDAVCDMKTTTESQTKNTTIMTSHPIILHRGLYFSAYTSPTLAIDSMADSPNIVRWYGVSGLAGYAR